MMSNKKNQNEQSFAYSVSPMKKQKVTDGSNTFYVVELGAGHAKLTYLIFLSVLEF